MSPLNYLSERIVLRTFIMTALLFVCSICRGTADTSMSRLVNHGFWIQVCGDNFASWDNHGRIDYVCPISLGYTCEFVSRRQNCLLASIGVGVGSWRWDNLINNTSGNKFLSVPLSVSWRKNYKRNALWAGGAIGFALGGQTYLYQDDQGFAIFQPNITYVLNPNVTYQFQNRTESWFLRLSYTPKYMPNYKYGGTCYEPDGKSRFHWIYFGLTTGFYI